MASAFANAGLVERIGGGVEDERLRGAVLAAAKLSALRDLSARLDGLLRENGKLVQRLASQESGLRAAKSRNPGHHIRFDDGSARRLGAFADKTEAALSAFAAAREAVAGWSPSPWPDTGAALLAGVRNPGAAPAVAAAPGVDGPDVNLIAPDGAAAVDAVFAAAPPGDTGFDAASLVAAMAAVDCVCDVSSLTTDIPAIDTGACSVDVGSFCP